METETNSIDRKVKFTGSQINYYFICKRKLWFFSHNIELEPESDLVKLGRLLHENRYKRKLKEIQVDRIKVDFMESKRASDSELSNATGSLGESLEATGPIPSNQVKPPPKEGFTARELVIHEVKRSKKMQDAHLYQLLYYMYYLRENYSVNSSRGVLHYPLLNQNVDVLLTEDRINQLEHALRGIGEVNFQPRPPEAEWKRYCRSCAYADLCWG